MNNTNNNDNPPPNPILSTYPFCLSTLNIRGLNSHTKQKQIIEMMELEHISILGLSETKINKSHSKFVFKEYSNRFTTYFDNDSLIPLGSGVGIIISNDYAKFVHTHKGYKGRVYHVDLFMKGHIKLRIIQVYLHANTTGNRNDIEDIHTYIFQLLNFARSHNYHYIIMGDFNVSYEKYKQDYQRKGSFHWSHNILHQIKHNYVMKDGIKLYH